MIVWIALVFSIMLLMDATMNVVTNRRYETWVKVLALALFTGEVYLISYILTLL